MSSLLLLPASASVIPSCVEFRTENGATEVSCVLSVVVPNGTLTDLGSSQVGLGVDSSGKLAGTGTRYLVLNGTGDTATEGIAYSSQQLAGSAGTLNQLYCKLSAAPGTGNSYAFTVRKNGTNTAIGGAFCTISDAATLCSDTGHSITVVQDDLLSISVVATGTPTPAAVNCSLTGPAVASITDTTTTNLTGLLAGNGTDVDAITTSAGLAGKISDETGTGALVFGTTPVLSNPSLGVTQLTVTHTASTAGTTINLLVCFDGTTGNVTTCATSAVGALGVAKTTQTSTQSVEVGTRGIGTCVSDNTVTVGNLLGVGTTTAGRCKDLGQTSSLSVPHLLQVVGRAMACSPCTAGNSITYQAYGPGVYGVSLASDSSGNVGIGTSTFGTNAAGVLALFAGTAPSTSPADTVQMWVGDIGGAAGKAGLNVRAEAGEILSFGNGGLRIGNGTFAGGLFLEVAGSTGSTDDNVVTFRTARNTATVNPFNFMFNRGTANVSAGEKVQLAIRSDSSTTAEAIVSRLEHIATTVTHASRSSAWGFRTIQSGTEAERFRVDAHINTLGTTPAVSNTSANSCGTTSATIVGTDHAGKVTVGATSGTSCTVTFATAFTNAPACWCNDETTAAACKAISTTTTVILSGTFTAADVLSYGCQAYL